MVVVGRPDRGMSVCACIRFLFDLARVGGVGTYVDCWFECMLLMSGWILELRKKSCFGKFGCVLWFISIMDILLLHMSVSRLYLVLVCWKTWINIVHQFIWYAWVFSMFMIWKRMSGVYLSKDINISKYFLRNDACFCFDFLFFSWERYFFRIIFMACFVSVSYESSVGCFNGGNSCVYRGLASFRVLERSLDGIANLL